MPGVDLALLVLIEARLKLGLFGLDLVKTLVSFLEEEMSGN